MGETEYSYFLAVTSMACTLSLRANTGFGCEQHIASHNTIAAKAGNRVHEINFFIEPPDCSKICAHLLATSGCAGDWSTSYPLRPRRSRGYSSRVAFSWVRKKKWSRTFTTCKKIRDHSRKKC